MKKETTGNIFKLTLASVSVLSLTSREDVATWGDKLTVIFNNTTKQGDSKESSTDLGASVKSTKHGSTEVMTEMGNLKQKHQLQMICEGNSA